MAKLFCHLLMKVNHVIVANFYVTNMSFNAICENKILAKISEFTVYGVIHLRFYRFYPFFSVCHFNAWRTGYNEPNEPYGIKSVPHAFNSHVSMSTNPCINKAIHVLLMHGFGILILLLPGH